MEEEEEKEEEEEEEEEEEAFFGMHDYRISSHGDLSDVSDSVGMSLDQPTG